MSPINQNIIDELNIDISAIAGVTQDSRKVEDGFLFAALQGGVDGRSFIPSALRSGASYILSDHSVTLDDGASAHLIKHENPRAVFAHIVSAFYKGQPEHMVAVTGTNGKSSVVHFLNQIWQACGFSSSYIGTLSGALTTPDPVTLHQELSGLSNNGVTHCAIEASSHGLDQNRVDGVDVRVAAFTSFSQDHLDYHQDMDEYFSAKARLFSEVMSVRGAAVLNADIPEFGRLKDICDQRGVRVLSFGENAHDVKLLRSDVVGQSQRMILKVFGEEYHVDLPLVGKFQAMNVLCALACALAQENVDAVKVIEALPHLTAVPGRLQHVQSDDGRYNAYVDYAHTADALRHVLTALRPHVTGRLICVFGAGGDRDATKRPMMGQVVGELSDIAIITDDNPRGEDPAIIRSAIKDGMKASLSDVLEVGSRKEAIAKAVSLMGHDDVLLVAGKGHEQGQIFADETIEFDDVSVVGDALSKLSVCIQEGTGR